MTLGVEFMLTTSEHRAAWDTTISAPKSVSLGALVGGDRPYQRRPPRERQRDAERVWKISASAWRRPTLASRFLSEQVGVRQASQI